MPTQEKPPADCLDRRRAGVLLHLTSLPGDGPCGCLGADAYRFADFLADGGFTVWQMLPVVPTSDCSPYHTNSSHAGSPPLIALEPLVGRGWLPGAAAEGATDLTSNIFPDVGRSGRKECEGADREDRDERTHDGVFECHGTGPISDEPNRRFASRSDGGCLGHRLRSSAGRSIRSA